MPLKRKKSVRPTLSRWLWTHRSLLFVIPLLFGAGSQWFPEKPVTLADAAPKVEEPFLYTVTRLPERAPRVATILANRQRSGPAVPTGQTVTVKSQAAPLPGETLSPRPAALPQVPIRVGIVRGAGRLRLETSTPVVICDRTQQTIATLLASTRHILRPGRNRLTAGELVLPETVWLKPQGDGLIAVNGRWYRGTVQLILEQQRVIAVNHLELEAYLYGVVGSEMPALWPMEALKAQAVAARSYALSRIAHPFSRHYDLGDTPRWQAYQGTETETESVYVAVDSTKGLVLGYDGSIVEALYAASEGLVRSVHRGYGMSQKGALKLAQTGFTYRQILSDFYPETELMWLTDAA